MTNAQDFQFRSIAVSAILPALLFSIGEGAIIPILPVVADNLGASLAIAGVVAAMIQLGTLLGDVPSGPIVARVGERNAMVGAAGLAIVGLVVSILAPNPWVLAVGVLLVGLATAVYSLARQAFMTSFVPLAYRARAMSLLGGSFRLGYFVGPFISAAIIHLTGSTQAVFWVHIVCCLAAAIVVLAVKDPAELMQNRLPGGRLPGEELVEQEAAGLFRTLRENAAVLVRMGLGSALIGAMRSSRQVILPLWAVSIGMPDAEAALVIGIAGAVDFALFYSSGQLMDRWGRLAAVLPCMLGLSIAHIVLGFTHDTAGKDVWFIVIALLMSVANGFGSGIIMTLGADLSNKDKPAPFLGAWRFTGDLGNAGSPLLLSALTAVLSISIASGIMGVIGIAGAVLLVRYIPRYVPHVRHGRPTPDPSA